MATGYVNRGFVLNDLREAGKASEDFRTALQLQPTYGEAHLGLAYADLQLHRPKPALAQLDAAEKILGKSHAWHLARAEAFRQEQDFPHAATEYRTALAEDSERFDDRTRVCRRALSHASLCGSDLCANARSRPVA